jgi:hypothetical protein
MPTDVVNGYFYTFMVSGKYHKHVIVIRIFNTVGDNVIYRCSSRGLLQGISNKLESDGAKLSFTVTRLSGYILSISDFTPTKFHNSEILTCFFHHLFEFEKALG